MLVSDREEILGTSKTSNICVTTSAERLISLDVHIKWERVLKLVVKPPKTAKWGGGVGKLWSTPEGKTDEK